jgi:hypothetical protein
MYMSKPVRTALVLLLILAGLFACSDSPMTTEPLRVKAYGFQILPGYWKDSNTFNAPSGFTGITGHPLNGCGGSGLSHVMYDSTLPKSADTVLVIQMNQGTQCPIAAYNSYSWSVSFITRRGDGFGYPITITGDTMLFIGTFTDSNHWSGKIVLAVAKTQVGIWTRERLVPTSLTELVKLNKHFDSSTKNMAPGSTRTVYTGKDALLHK